MKLTNICFAAVFLAFTLKANSGPNSTPKTQASHQVKITWEELKDGIPKLCKGIKSTGRHIQDDACVFWSQDQESNWNCLIFTKENVSNESFGKLVKHCYQKIYLISG